MIHTIQNNYLTVQVKNAGAELCSIKDKAGTEYLFDANPAYWGRSAPVLFPFVGSLKNKSFVYEGKSYQMGQHGFARDRDFSLLQKEEASIWFRLTSNEETLAIYPLPFVLDIGGMCTILQIKAFSSLSAHIQRSSVLPAAAEWTAAIWDLICPATFPIACLTIRDW